jgi:hypothetical protein
MEIEALPQAGGGGVEFLVWGVLIMYLSCNIVHKTFVILCSNVYEPPSHLRDGGGCILVGRNTLLKKMIVL